MADSLPSELTPTTRQAAIWQTLVKHRIWIIGGALAIGIWVVVHKMKQELPKQLAGVDKKLNERAANLLISIAQGQDRVVYYSNTPFGWALLERQGLATRVGDRAKLTPAGERQARRYLIGFEKKPLGLGAASRTYAQAQREILAYLQANRWAVKPNLKIPYATSPDGETRIWFKPQGVWFTEGRHHEYKDARTVSYDQDIRKLDGPNFVEWIRSIFRRSGGTLGAATKRERYKTALKTTKEALIKKFEDAKANAAARPSSEARAAVVKASAELSAWIMQNDPPKVSGYASRAGIRQYKERYSGRR